MPDIGQVLVEANVLTEEKLREARAAGGENLAATLVDKRFVNEADFVAAVAKRFGLAEAKLDNFEPDPEAVKLLPEAVAKATQCVPMKKEGAILHVATCDPANERAQDRVARTTGLSVKVLIAGPKALEKAMGVAYGGGGAKGDKRRKATPADSGPSLKELDQVLKNAVQEVNPEEPDENEDLRNLPKLEVRELDAPVVRIINGLLLKALKMRASDLHIEPLEDSLRVRFRIDGCLIEVLRLSKEMKGAISSCLKIMSNMDIAEKRVPQDGGIKMALGDNGSIDFRVSSLPNLYGEKLVLRVLGTSDLKGSVDELGFEGRALELCREAVDNPYGMILVTGPTGSGKTTTLYTILNQLNQADVNITTAEDPVEYTLSGITQVNVRHATGLTFEAAMRSFLRQDPDIILVGEMRDYETAAIAVKAALTGHLVLSTLHTNDAPSTVVRLVDMGIEPYLVASAVKLVVAQRLIRRICKNCKEDVNLAELEKTDLDQTTLASVEYMARGKGCDVCNNIGYKGRVPVFEVLAVRSKDMKRAITEGGTEVQVAQIAKREGMQTLAECAIELVNKGITTLEEARSVIMAE
jgi:type IV pilus assembly protein PilB